MSGRSDLPTPEEWEKLKAEWMHDYELRRMENRGMKYEDEADRKLDHAAERGTGGGQDVPPPSSAATVTPPGRAALPPHPWPSEVACQNRHQPEQVHDKSNGRDAGHSM
jgi:hypothetical protein